VVQKPFKIKKTGYSSNYNGNPPSNPGKDTEITLLNRSGGMILALLTRAEMGKKDLEFLKFAHQLAKGLKKRLMVIAFKRDSLSHYGEVDSLASFKDKAEFVSYVSRLEDKEYDDFKKTVLSACPGSQITLLNRENLERFIDRIYSEILFVIIQEKGCSRPFFHKNPAYLKSLKRKNINILMIRNTRVLSQ